MIARLLAAFAVAAAASIPALGAGLIATGGATIPGSSRLQGAASFAAMGVGWDKPISRRFSARLEVFPVQLFRERERPVGSANGRETVLASAACLLARYALVSSPSPLFLEAGAGPVYAYRRRVPPGGTRANFFDQIGIAWMRGRWTLHARFTHVSNLDLQGRNRNAGFSFLGGAIGWEF